MLNIDPQILKDINEDNSFFQPSGASLDQTKLEVLARALEDTCSIEHERRSRGESFLAQAL